MKIYSVSDPEFKPYGKVLEGYDTAELVAAMEAIPLPETGTAYRPGIDSLEALIRSYYQDYFPKVEWLQKLSRAPIDREPRMG